MESMKSNKTHPLDGNIEIDETFVGGKEKVKRGRSKGSKKQVVFILETKGKGISRAYGKVITRVTQRLLLNFCILLINIS